MLILSVSVRKNITPFHFNPLDTSERFRCILLTRGPDCQGRTRPRTPDRGGRVTYDLLRSLPRPHPARTVDWGSTRLSDGE